MILDCFFLFTEFSANLPSHLPKGPSSSRGGGVGGGGVGGGGGGGGSAIVWSLRLDLWRVAAVGENQTATDDLNTTLLMINHGWRPYIYIGPLCRIILGSAVFAGTCTRFAVAIVR